MCPATGAGRITQESNMTSTETASPGGLVQPVAQNSVQPAQSKINQEDGGCHLSNFHVFRQSTSPDELARGVGVYPSGYAKRPI